MRIPMKMLIEKPVSCKFIEETDDVFLINFRTFKKIVFSFY